MKVYDRVGQISQASLVHDVVRLREEVDQLKKEIQGIHSWIERIQTILTEDEWAIK